MIMSWFTTVPRPKMLPVSNALVALETLVQHFPATFEKPLAWRHSSEVPRPELRALRDSSASASPVVVLKALDAYLLDLCQEEEAKELTQIIDHDQGCLHEAYYTFLHRRVHQAAMIRIGAMTPFVSIVSPEIDVQLNMLARILSSLDFLQPNKRPVDQLQRVFFSSQTVEWNAMGETRFLDLAAAAPFPIQIEGKEWRPNHDANHTSGIRGWTYHHLTSAAEYIADTQQDLSLFLKNMAGRIRQATIHWIHGHVALLLLYQHYGIGGIEIQDRIFVVDWSARPRPPRRPLNDWRQVFGLVVTDDDSEDDDDTFEVRLPVEKQLAKFYRASLDTRNVPFVKRRIYELVALSGVSHLSSIEPWPFARSQLDFVASFTLPTKDEQLRDEISRQIRFEKRGRRVKDTTGMVKKKKKKTHDDELRELEEATRGRQVGQDAVQDFRNRIDDMMMDLEAGKYGQMETGQEEPDEAEFQRVQARILAERETKKRDVIPNVLFNNS